MLSLNRGRELAVVAAGACFIAATYGLVRLAYGLFLPEIQKDLGLSAVGAGYISSGSSLAYCVAAAVAFVLGRRMPRALIIAAVASACGGVWGMAAAGGIGAFGVCAVLSSAGAGFASPALVSIVARNVDAPRIDSAQSVVNAGTGPGLVCAGVLALLLLPDWRPAWVLIGALTAAVAAAVLVLDRPATTGPQQDPPRTLTRAWLSRHLSPLAAAVLLGTGSSAVWTYGRSLLVETGSGSERDTVTAWIVLGLGATCAIVTAGPLTKLAPTTAWMLSCSAATCAGLLLAVASQHTAVAYLACLLFGWGFIAGTSVLISWTSSIDPANAAAGTAMLFVALVFGQAAGATAVGYLIAATGYSTAFTIAGALSAAAVAVGALHRRPPASA